MKYVINSQSQKSVSAVNSKKNLLTIIFLICLCIPNAFAEINDIVIDTTISPADKLSIIKLYKEGNINISKGNWELAEQKFLRINNITPNIPAIHHSLGLIYIQTGDTTSAIMYFNKALEKNPKEFKSLYALGKAHYRKKNHKKAKFYYLEALEVPGDKVAVYQNLAGVYYDEENWERALEYLTLARDINPKSPFTLKLMAYTAMRLERVDVVIDIIMELKKMQHFKLAQQIEEMLNKI
ncbi:MAG: tetratricopeptide (TPR) repeat protein [Candidatus Omnitrophota bacterium]|jgi:tetratricopeptide (TPR) repeat protein